MEVRYLRAFLFLYILLSCGICMAQGQIATEKAIANSQITVRIPSFAIITLAGNNSKAVSYKSAPDLRKSVTFEVTAVADVVSNRKWSVNVCREEDVSNTYTSTSTVSKSVDIHATTSPSLTVIYVTTLN